jgi:hypothetical protein
MSKPLLWFVLLFASVSIIGIGATTPLQAQFSVACLDDCPFLPMNPSQRSILTIGGCTIRVTWITRTGCNGFTDIVIQSVEMLTDGCSTIHTIGEWVNIAQREVLRQLTGGFYPFTSPFDTCVNWRVMKPACWHWNVDCYDSMAVPCDSSNCCVTYWKACKYGTTKSLVKVAEAGAQPCDSVSWNGGCRFACDDTTHVIYVLGSNGGDPDPMQQAKPIVPPVGDPVGKIGKRPDGLQAVPQRE